MSLLDMIEQALNNTLNSSQFLNIQFPSPDESFVIKNACKYITDFDFFNKILQHYNLTIYSEVDSIPILLQLVCNQNQSIILEYYHNLNDTAEFIKSFYEINSFTRIPIIYYLCSQYSTWNVENYKSFLSTVLDENYMNKEQLIEMCFYAMKARNRVGINCIFDKFYDIDIILGGFNLYRDTLIYNIGMETRKFIEFMINFIHSHKNKIPNV